MSQINNNISTELLLRTSPIRLDLLDSWCCRRKIDFILKKTQIRCDFAVTLLVSIIPHRNHYTIEISKFEVTKLHGRVGSKRVLIIWKYPSWISTRRICNRLRKHNRTSIIHNTFTAITRRLLSFASDLFTMISESSSTSRTTGIISYQQWQHDQT